MLLNNEQNNIKTRHEGQNMIYNGDINKEKGECLSMIRRELLNRAVEQEMEHYFNEEMDCDEPVFEDIDEIQNHDTVKNPLNERSIEIRQAIEEHLDKRRMRSQISDLTDDDYFYDEE